MSKISLSNCSGDIIVEILTVMIPVFEKLGIDFFVVGAFARDIHLRGSDNFEQRRRTDDLDLGVMVATEEDFNKLFEALLSIPEFSKHVQPHRLWYKQGIEVDLLPFGYITNLEGDVTLHGSKDFTLQMPGFREAYNFSEVIVAEEGFELKVTSLPAIIILKLIAWDDRPERTKDISDILYIIQNLYLLKIEVVVEDDYDLVELYSEKKPHYTTLVSAHYLGRKIGNILNESISEILPKRIFKILETNTSKNKSRIAEIMKYETIEEGIEILNALFHGINERFKVLK